MHIKNLISGHKWFHNSYEHLGPITYKYGGPITISIHLLFCVAFRSGRFTEMPCVNQIEARFKKKKKKKKEKKRKKCMI
jgi:hypothetical protein